MTTPVQRISRLITEGARFMVQIPGHVAIDLTPDVIAAIAEVQTQREGFETIKESIGPEVHGRDVPTHVQFT